MSDVLQNLAAVLEQRKSADPEKSYVASLHKQGLNKILEKVGEESTEVILAAKDASTGADNSDLVGEVADLWFHTIVMLSHLNVDVDEVTTCLAGRMGVSGIHEKSERKNSS
ncbi:MAG: phosphoribosyl-ATP diphosphatase [Pseudomonadota bacterium]